MMEVHPLFVCNVRVEDINRINSNEDVSEKALFSATENIS